MHHYPPHDGLAAVAVEYRLRAQPAAVPVLYRLHSWPVTDSAVNYYNHLPDKPEIRYIQYIGQKICFVSMGSILLVHLIFNHSHPINQA